jgi:streptogramin lyase
VVTAALALLAAGSAAAPAGAATSVRLPDGFQPGAVAAGAAGSIWLASDQYSRAAGLALLAADGSMRAFPSPGGTIDGLAASADGAAWFTDATSAIGHVTPAGDVVRIETHVALAREQTFGAIAPGAAGHLWFDAGAGRIGELATDGSLVQVLAPPAGEGTRRLVAADPADGLWVAGSGGASGTTLSRLAPDGSAAFRVDLPSYANGAAVHALAPDGSLWVATGADLARVTPTGALSVVALAGKIVDDVRSLAFDAAGTLWFSTWSTAPYFFVAAPAEIGSLDAAGALTLYPQLVDPAFVAVATDGALWFARTAKPGAVATRVTPPPPSACVVPDVYGQALVVARSAIDGAGCTVAAVRGSPGGAVWGVSPVPATVLPRGGRVTVQLGRGQPPVTGTWRGYVTTEQCNKNGGTTPSGEYSLGTLRVAPAARGRLVATFAGRRLLLRRHRGSTYRFVSRSGGSVLSLKKDGASASIVLLAGSAGCGQVATTGALLRTAAR